MRLLVLERGELAAASLDAARRLGIETVAADAGEGGPHLAAADWSVQLPEAPAAQAVVAAARRAGADTVLPGSGPLALDARFAAHIRDSGLALLAPANDVLARLGAKDLVKRLVKAAGIPVVPGYMGDDQSLSRLERAAAALGYPLLIKGVAGGNGRGVCRVDDPARVADALLTCKRGAERAGVSDRVMLERCLAAVRHVEVPVIAGEADEAVYNPPRDASLQRAFTPLLVETPAPDLSDDLRRMLGVAALTAAQAVEFRGVGAAEFLLNLDERDAAGDPAFLFIGFTPHLTARDLVTAEVSPLSPFEWQLRLALGQRLADATVSAGGPEQPSNHGLLAMLGRSGPLIVAQRPDRGAALRALTRQLDLLWSEGGGDDLAFLSGLLREPELCAGPVTTSFAERLPARSSASPDQLPIVAAIAVATSPAPGATLYAATGGWRLNLPPRQRITLIDGAGAREFVVEGHGPDLTVSGDGPASRVSARRLDPSTLDLEFEDCVLRARVRVTATEVEVRTGGHTSRFIRSGEPAPRASAEVVSPLPAG